MCVCVCVFGRYLLSSKSLCALNCRHPWWCLCVYCAPIDCQINFFHPCIPTTELQTFALGALPSSAHAHYRATYRELSAFCGVHWQDMSTDISVRITGSRGRRFSNGGTPYQPTVKVCPLVFALRSLIFRFAANSDVLSTDSSSRNRRLQCARRLRCKHNFDFAGGTVFQL